MGADLVAALRPECQKALDLVRIERNEHLPLSSQELHFEAVLKMAFGLEPTQIRFESSQNMYSRRWGRRHRPAISECNPASRLWLALLKWAGMLDVPNGSIGVFRGRCFSSTFSLAGIGRTDPSQHLLFGSASRS